MTAIEKTQAISDLLESELPALLALAGLDNFDNYANKPPLVSNDLELCVYIDFESDSTDLKVFDVVLQAQLHAVNKSQEYHSVIMPFLEEKMIGYLVDMTERTEIKAELWPMDSGSSTAYIFYSIGFETSLDDCGN